MADEILAKRVAPSSLEAEQSVVGAMLIDRDAIGTATEFINGDDFYNRQLGTLFDAMVNKINNQTVSILMRGQIPVQEAPDEPSARRVEVRQAAPEQRQDMSKYRENKQDLNDPNQQAAANQDTREQQKREPIRAEKTVGRNDPCPCGSGKKYKNCHGQNA